MNEYVSGLPGLGLNDRHALKALHTSLIVVSKLDRLLNCDFKLVHGPSEFI